MIFPSTSAKNLCVIIVTKIKLDKYINYACKSAYFHIKNISHIDVCLCLSEDAAIFSHAFIKNKIDYYNFPLYGLMIKVLVLAFLAYHGVSPTYL